FCLNEMIGNCFEFPYPTTQKFPQQSPAPTVSKAESLAGNSEPTSAPISRQQYSICGSYVNFALIGAQDWTSAPRLREAGLNHLAVGWVESKLFCFSSSRLAFRWGVGLFP